jgi:hypothetical protein
MDRNSLNDSQTRELTEAELDAVSGGFIVSVEQPTAVMSAEGGTGTSGKTAIIAIL